MIVINPRNEIFSHFWLGVRQFFFGKDFFHDAFNVCVDDGIFRDGNCPNETVVKRHELLFEVERFAIPPDDSSLYNVRPEEVDRPSVPDGASVLNDVGG